MKNGWTMGWGILSTLIMVTAIAATGCGARNTSGPVPLAKPQLTDEMARPFQVSDSQRCLSLAKVYAAASVTGQLRSTTTDARVIEDGSPVSLSFIRSFVRDTAISGSFPAKNEPGWSQNGCDSISLMAGKAELARLKLIEASPTRLVTERYEFRKGSRDSESYQLSVGLLSNEGAVISWSMPHRTQHLAETCRVKTETHAVFLTTILEFGTASGKLPILSPGLKQAKAMATAYEDPKKADQARLSERNYCAQVVRIRR